MNSVRKFVFTVSLLVAFGYLEASCPLSTYQQIGSKCLRPVLDSVTWTAARDACADDGAHLAFFNDCSLTHTIYTFLSIINPSNKYWVGASKSANGDTWLWTDNTEVQMGVPFWGSSTPGWTAEPNGEEEGVSYCAFADGEDQFYLHDEDCSATLNYLCEAEPISLSKTENEEPSKNLKKKGTEATECPTDFILISGSCFYFHFNSKDEEEALTSFTGAQSVCEEREARLAEFESCSLFGDVVAYINLHSNLQLPKGASYWIGAKDEGIEGEYNWIGTYHPLQLGPPFWGSSNGVAEPAGDVRQNCAVLYRDNQYYLHDGECYKKAYPLCEYVE